MPRTLCLLEKKVNEVGFVTASSINGFVACLKPAGGICGAS